MDPVKPTYQPAPVHRGSVLGGLVLFTRRLLNYTYNGYLWSTSALWVTSVSAILFGAPLFFIIGSLGQGDQAQLDQRY